MTTTQTDYWTHYQKPLTKKQIASVIAETRGLEITKKDTQHVLDLFVALMQKEIRRHRRFSIKGFGTFTVRTRRARMGVNPKTKQPIRIPANRTVGFRPAPSWKRTL